MVSRDPFFDGPRPTTERDRTEAEVRRRETDRAAAEAERVRMRQREVLYGTTQICGGQSVTVLFSCDAYDRRAGQFHPGFHVEAANGRQFSATDKQLGL